MIPNTSRLPLLVSHNWTIRRIKTEIAKCTGIPTYKQRLFSKESSGDLLPDYKTIMDCGFHPKDALELSLAGTIDPDQPCKSKGVQATITRPCDIRVRIPKTNRIVALKCDKTDTSAAVKARFAGKMDPQRCRRLVHTLPCVEDAQEDDQDPDEYLEQCLKTLSLDSVGSMGDAALGGDFKVGAPTLVYSHTIIHHIVVRSHTGIGTRRGGVGGSCTAAHGSPARQHGASA